MAHLDRNEYRGVKNGSKLLACKALAAKNDFRFCFSFPKTTTSGACEVSELHVTCETPFSSAAAYGRGGGFCCVGEFSYMGGFCGVGGVGGLGVGFWVGFPKGEGFGFVP